MNSTGPWPEDHSDGVWSWFSSLPLFRDRPFAAYAVGIAVFVLALALRLEFDPVLPPGFPFLTFFPAVILTAFFCGWRSGAVCALLSGVAAWYWFIRPFSSSGLSGSAMVALAFYLFIVSVDILLIHFMHRASERLLRKRALISQLLDDQRVMFQELQHRVANNMQFVSSLLRIEKRRMRGDPALAEEILDTAQVRIELISQLHRKLYEPEKARIPVATHLRDLARDLLRASGSSSAVTCRVECPDLVLDLGTLTTLSLLTVELMTNALKHAFPDGREGTIIVSLSALEDDRYRLVVADDGGGLPATFDAASGGLGLRIIRGLADKLGATVRHETGSGTRAIVEFRAPVAGGSRPDEDPRGGRH